MKATLLHAHMHNHRQEGKALVVIHEHLHRHDVYYEEVEEHLPKMHTHSHLEA